MDDFFRKIIDRLTLLEEQTPNKPDVYITMSGETQDEIMQGVWRKLYPNVKLYCSDEESDMAAWRTEKDLEFNEPPGDGEFLVTTRGNELNLENVVVSIDGAWSGKYRRVVGQYIKECFEWLEEQYRTDPESNGYPPPPRLLMLYSRDGSGGTWEHIAAKLNAQLEDSPWN